MDKNPSSSKAAASSTSGKSQKRKADGKKTTKKGAGQSSSKKSKPELDIDLLLQSAKQHTKARHEDVFHGRHHGTEIENDEDDENIWVVGGYTVKRVQMKCKKGRNCEWYCPECRVCAHQFECGCGDKPYLCVHVHFICEVEGMDSRWEQDSESDADESEEEEKKKISTTFSECTSLLNDKKAAEILQKNLDKTLVQLQTHGEKLNKEAEKAAKKKK